MGLEPHFVAFVEQAEKTEELKITMTLSRAASAFLKVEMEYWAKLGITKTAQQVIEKLIIESGVALVENEAQAKRWREEDRSLS